MRIDAHQHFWSYVAGSEEFSWIDDSMRAIQRSFLPEDLEPLLRAEGFDGCVAVQAAQTEQENQFLLGLSQRAKFVRGVVGWADLRAPNVGDELDRLQAYPKFRGVRRSVQAEPAAILKDANFRRGISALAPRGLTYDLLVYQHQLLEAVAFVRDFPEQAIVLDHLGKPLIGKGELDPWATHLQALGRCDNCYCKLSGLVTEADWVHWSPDDLRPYLDVVFNAFPAERLMFGSDWPVCLLAAPYARVVEIIEEYVDEDAPEPHAGVFGENAARFYGI
jgi:L-fuconolactonase